MKTDREELAEAEDLLRQCQHRLADATKKLADLDNRFFKRTQAKFSGEYKALKIEQADMAREEFFISQNITQLKDKIALENKSTVEPESQYNQIPGQMKPPTPAQPAQQPSWVENRNVAPAAPEAPKNDQYGGVPGAMKKGDPNQKPVDKTPTAEQNASPRPQYGAVRNVNRFAAIAQKDPAPADDSQYGDVRKINRFAGLPKANDEKAEESQYQEVKRVDRSVNNAPAQPHAQSIPKPSASTNLGPPPPKPAHKTQEQSTAKPSAPTNLGPPPPKPPHKAQAGSTSKQAPTNLGPPPPKPPHKNHGQSHAAPTNHSMVAPPEKPSREGKVDLNALKSATAELRDEGQKKESQKDRQFQQLPKPPF